MESNDFWFACDIHAYKTPYTQIVYIQGYIYTYIKCIHACQSIRQVPFCLLRVKQPKKNPKQQQQKLKIKSKAAIFEKVCCSF